MSFVQLVISYLVLLVLADVSAQGSQWIDRDTRSSAYELGLCTAEQRECDRGVPKTSLKLVFSDEFEDPRRGFALENKDPKWTAVDIHYSSDDEEAQNYKPVAVTTERGALKITISNDTTTAPKMAQTGETWVTRDIQSGMLQSWNKFCYTGGYIEFSIQLPTDAGGLWPAGWLLGNLARPGFYQTTEGTWPYSTSRCQKKVPSWMKGAAPQMCPDQIARGGPELDILEVGTFAGQLKVLATLQMAPKVPPPDIVFAGGKAMNVTWPNQKQPPSNWNTWPGITFPGAGRLPYDNRPAPKQPGEISYLSDMFTAENDLPQSWTKEFHTFGFLWEPGKLIRWDLDGEAIFEITQEALEPMKNNRSESVMQRDIPFEPMSIILNIALKKKGLTSWAPWVDELEFPAHMYVDYVRVYQDPSNPNHTLGCSPDKYPTADFINCAPERYLTLEERISGLWELPDCPLMKDNNFRFVVSFGSACLVVLVSCGLIHLLSARYSKPVEREEHLQNNKAGVALYQPYIQKAATTEHIKDRHPELVRIAARSAQQEQAGGGSNG